MAQPITATKAAGQNPPNIANTATAPKKKTKIAWLIHAPSAIVSTIATPSAAAASPASARGDSRRETLITRWTGVVGSASSDSRARKSTDGAETAEGNGVRLH